MKSHHLLLMPFILLLLLPSCTSYQYATLSSSLPKSQYNDFFFENDTLQVIFSFSGQNCPINIDIYNKLDQPIWIHWDKTKVINNNQSVAFKPFIPMISNISVIQNTYLATLESQQNTFITPSITQQNQSEFIPPKSQICATHFGYSSGFMHTTNATSSGRDSIPFSGTSAMKYYFSQNDSPLEFSCYITYSDSENDSANMQHIIGDFWVDNVFKKVALKLPDSPDRFYSSRLTGFGGFMCLVALTAYVIIEVAADDAPVE